MAQKRRSPIIVIVWMCLSLTGLTVSGYPQEKSESPPKPEVKQPPNVQKLPLSPRRQNIGLLVIADLSVTPFTHTGPCPALFTFTGQIYANRPTTISYKFVRS